MELADPDGANPVDPVREIAGPADPEEDGTLEVNYFFTILAGSPSFV